MIEGLFIAIEGIDGAGTTTQCRRLSGALRVRGLPVHTTREPSDGPIGSLLRLTLGGRVVVPGMHGSRPPGWSTMALLFAADRLDHLEAEVLPNLMDGVTVITDRYDMSSVAYQSVTSGRDDVIPWLVEINARARRPDLTIVLDVDPSDASTRRELRSEARDLYEEDELQTKLAAFYEGADRYFESDRIVHIDGSRSIDDVAADVLAAVDDLRSGG